MEAYVFFHNWKSIGCIHKKFCIVLRTLSRIEWCNFCIENLNLEFVFAIARLYLTLHKGGLAKKKLHNSPSE